VFINSSVGLNARAKVSQYAATKHALKAIADSLREEVNAAGVRVISIYPGRTASPMQAMIYQLEERVYQPEQLIQPEEIATVITTVLGLPKGAEVTDINIRPAKK
jgi:NADP-dependent 3-hydroxy acid dehydrogenase YdfG